MIRRLLADQRVRFLLVGGWNFVFGYALYAGFYYLLFREVPFGYLISLVLSWAISILVSFVLYRRFVFKVTGRVGRDLLGFLGVYAVSFTINFVALPLLVEVAHVPPLLAQAILLVVTVLVSYFGHREVSFRRPSARADE